MRMISSPCSDDCELLHLADVHGLGAGLNAAALGVAAPLEAQACACGLVLVSRNLREFQRVNGLTVENWERVKELRHTGGFWGGDHPAHVEARALTGLFADFRA